MLLLDAEALSAVAHGPAKRRSDVLALVAEARGRGHAISTVAAVLAEVVRGRPQNAAVFAALRREQVRVAAVDGRVGVRAGQLLGAIGADSALAVDAFVVAVGDLAGGAVVATGDPNDLRRLASEATAVRIEPI
ncbi:MAG: hypothetical protein ACT4QG_10710 [Sporichthyaceae bacterium]